MIDEREEILKGMRAGPLVLRALVRGLDDVTVRTRPADNEWAIIEVVAHLADTDERALLRTRAMLVEDEPTLVPYDQHELAEERRYLEMELDHELDRFERLRREQTELLAGLDDAAWRRIGNHGEHGRITVEQLAAHTAGEDVDHFAQIARMLST
ncbi:MAG TPA: DinB family protein [Candidatus Limnocylindria bacterium]